MRLARAVMIIAVLGLAACTNSQGLRILSSDDEGPDEFRILPSKPLSAPENYAELPTPTPGGSNLTDQNPIGDAVAALGGRGSATVPGEGFASADASLVGYVSRNGIQTDIRETLLAEDEEKRRKYLRFSRIKITAQDRYNRAYRDYHLNAYRELTRWRRAGARTPAAPPLNR